MALRIVNYRLRSGDDMSQNEGYFHGWGLEAHESNDGNISYSVALIEDTNGNIHTVTPNWIRFKLSPYKNELSRPCLYRTDVRKDFVMEATFHSFGIEHQWDSDTNTNTQYSVAILEDEEGNLFTIAVDGLVKFNDLPAEVEDEQ